MNLRFLQLLTLGLAIAFLALTLAGCGKSNDGKKKTKSTSSPSDGTTTQSATAVIEDLGNAGDNTPGNGVALLSASGTRQPAAWYERWLPERSAWGATSVSCAAPTWGIPTSTTVTLTPRTCTFNNGVTTWTVSWSGAFLFTFQGPGACLPSQDGTVTPSALPSGCTITRTTSPTATRSVMDSTHTYSVIRNTHFPGGWDDSVTTNSNGVAITCGSGGCPTLDDSTGLHSRSIAVGGTHLTGTLNGVPFWDHTVSTLAGDPIVIVGSGQYRVVPSGTLIVQHNLVHVTATVTVTSPLIHQVACGYPVGGSITATFASGKWAGKTERLTYGPTCGDATVTDSDGTATAVALTQ